VAEGPKTSTKTFLTLIMTDLNINCRLSLINNNHHQTLSLLVIFLFFFGLAFRVKADNAERWKSVILITSLRVNYFSTIWAI